MKPYCFASNAIITSEKASVHPMDIGLIRGYGIFDFFRTVNYVPLFLEEYLDRFFQSAKKTYLVLNHNREELKEIILELIRKNDLKSGGVRMLLTGGISDNHFSPSEGKLFIFCENLLFPNKEKYLKGVKLLSAEHVRAISDIKTTNYAFPVWQSKFSDWKKNNAEDVLYHNQGMVSESSRSNLFIIKNGVISTPEQNILHGITRKKVLELSGSTIIRQVGLEETIAADEVFMTSTTKKILPVTEIDNFIIGNGKPGPLTQELMEAFEKLELEKAY